MQFIETPTCNISKASGMGKVLQKCKLIVWDECTRGHKKSLEACHRSLQDFCGNIRPFGNTLILLAGDFRQILPVIPRSTPADEINACLKYSYFPRIPMIPMDVPLQFKRLQFPIRLVFAITINKAQGQSLELCSLDLDTGCFSHGQLHVACSRVGKPDNLYICTDNGTTKNIVYPQAL
ncbi:hypothetical protein B7P43_G09110 [Cryptotermes secundus]|uniref:ATP-dependent DNA helicase n=1 Tax=Cryptotermes secundus TaxID=105785 RepID=A0A2J7RAH9_9NEOP|nr:hypothetical protein B7P43_G09110 [Cryptotermes secundus]